MDTTRKFFERIREKRNELKNLKMWWLIEQFATNDGKNIKYEIQYTGEKKGTIVMPTGAGKSGVMFKDMIWHILNTKGKIVFNISAPILKLCNQSANDFFSVVEHLFPEQCKKGEFKIFINSSTSGKNYKDSTRNIGNVYNFNDISIFEKDERARVAIVISCHKSLYKFGEQVDYLNSFANTINYLDEAHLLVNLKGRRDNHKEKNFTEEEKKQFDTMKVLLRCDYLYALSATPDKNITKLINESVGRNSNYHMIDIPPQELIKSGIILKPAFDCVEIDEGREITPELAIKFMERCIEIEPNINHKILISCDPGEHIERLLNGLNKYKQKVFSTCARFGEKSNTVEEFFNDDVDEDSEEFKDISETEFIKEVDEWNGNCFVLHIRKLRQGIDIRTLTDCIICNRGTKINDGEKTVIIQTAGRVLRPYKNERPEELKTAGKTLAERKKIQGNILFVIGSSNYDDIKRQTTNHMIEYYGLEGVKAFSLDPEKDYGQIGKKKTRIEGWCSGSPSWYDDALKEIETLKANIYEFMKDTVLPMSAWEINMGGELSFDDALNQVKQKFGYVNDMIPVCSLVSNHELMKIVSETLNTFGIKNR